MFKYYVMFFVSLCIIGHVDAQKDKNNQDQNKFSDFIITNSYDTVYGKITGNLTPAITSVRITFIDKKTETKKVYKAQDIKSWHPADVDFYYESKEYRPVGLKSNEMGYGVYMKCLIPYKGTVRLYEYYNTDQEQGRMQIFLERGNKMEELNMMKFRKAAAEYFKDHVELSNKIKDRKYKRKDLKEIVDEYNRWKNRKA